TLYCRNVSKPLLAISLLYLKNRPHPISTLFPYTTLFRSISGRKRIVNQKILSKDGHPSFTPNSSVFISDTYPQKNEKQVLFVHKDRKSTRLNSSHVKISYAVFCLKKKKNMIYRTCCEIKK